MSIFKKRVVVSVVLLRSLGKRILINVTTCNLKTFSIKF